MNDIDERRIKTVLNNINSINDYSLFKIGRNKIEIKAQENGYIKGLPTK